MSSEIKMQNRDGEGILRGILRENSETRNSENTVTLRRGILSGAMEKFRKTSHCSSVSDRRYSARGGRRSREISVHLFPKVRLWFPLREILILASFPLFPFSKIYICRTQTICRIASQFFVATIGRCLRHLVTKSHSFMQI